MSLRAFYGDNNTPRIFAIDADTMTRIVDDDIPVNAPAYPVDRIQDNLLYAITRGVDSVTPIDAEKYVALDPISLTHKPRSTASRRIGRRTLCLVAGADQPVTSVVDVTAAKVIQTSGSPTFETETDYGGTLASGHPKWIDDESFFVLDRRRRTISAYALNSALPHWQIRTPTSVHHLADLGTKELVALCEGNPESSIPPSLIFLKKRPLQATGHFFLPSAAGGAHHISITRNRSFVYVPTSDKRVWVVDISKRQPQLKTSFAAGLGAGHVFFGPNTKDNVGVVVNHADTFITLFDESTHKAIGTVKVASRKPPAGKKSQAHTAKFSANGRYFYGAASEEGEFFRVDISAMKKDRVLNLNTFENPANPWQGTIF